MDGKRASILLFAALSGCLLATGAHADSRTDLPPGPGRDLVYAKCQTCHDPQYLHDSAGLPREEWDAAIDNMRQYGLRIPADQRAKILEYLATYLGPNPPPATPASAPANATPVNGETLYNEQCSGCHQPKGQGVKNQFPPLAGNSDLFLAADYPVKVVLFGMKGKLTVGGMPYNSEMPPFGHLSDAEIAGVINYVRKAWGNGKLNNKKLPVLDAAQVAAVRKTQMAPQAVLAYRKSLQ